MTATGSTGPTTYDVYRATISGGPYTLQAVLTTLRGPTTAGPTAPPKYYVVKAVVLGTSPLSTEVSATP